MARRLVVSALAFSAAMTAVEAVQLRSETVATGLHHPVAVVADPLDRDTFFIVEQAGRVRVLREGTLLDRPFLDLRGEVSSGGERGLLGMAFAPDAAISGRFFVNFTNGDGDTVVARFERSRDGSLTADIASRHDLLWPDSRRVIAQPFANHNGGHLAFGPDGYLYIGLGDGGSGGDPLNHAQRPDSLLGKMLRIDINVPNGDSRGYRVPEDNPFVGNEDLRVRPETWAFGLRNPWRYSFDDWTRGGTASLVIADVGQNAREEINFEPAGRGGRNYGWRIREGREPYDDRSAAAFLPLTEPIHDYDRSYGGSITGGLVYRGGALDPSFHGRYFYADFISGRVWSIGLHLDVHGEASKGDDREHTPQLAGRATVGMVSAFAQDHDGEMLLLSYSNGSVLRVVPDPDVVPSAPAVSATFDEAVLRLTWTHASPSAVAAYLVERVRGAAVIERQRVERPEAIAAVEPGECLRVRAEGRTGWSGPPSPVVCRP